MTIPAGTVLGSYEVVGLLGSGGMGEVYRARDGKLGRDVALKVLAPAMAGDPERLRRFADEARAASALNHPSIVSVYDVACTGDTPWIAFELLEGLTLRDVVGRGPLPMRRLLDLGIEIADGLAKAHAAGILHRDLKPANVIVTREGHAKILDFGLAKRVTPTPDVDSTTETADATRPGLVLGTLGYMSPEQASGRPVDAASDQFSFGAMLYEMASGRTAFQHQSHAEALAAVLRDVPEPLRRIRPELPVALRSLIEDRCLAKDPNERYASTLDLLRELRSIRDHLGDDTPPAAVSVVAASKFRKLTFQRGTISAARFTSDDVSVAYAASWDGSPSEVYLTRTDSTVSRPLGLQGADLLALSPAGELAVLLNRGFIGGWSWAGTLARMALLGGAPRELLEDVEWGDWSPDGRSLAIVRRVGARSQLEHPPGRVLFTTAGWISHPRFSRRGDLVAFLDHPLQDDDAGVVTVVDLTGQARTLGDAWGCTQGLAWSPAGDEVWFAASQDNIRALRAVSLAGVTRTVLNVPMALTLHDVSASGRVLLASEMYRSAVFTGSVTTSSERDVSCLDWSVAVDLSADGRVLLMAECGPDDSVYLRALDQPGPGVMLGVARALALSPDASWALARMPSGDCPLALFPTRAGAQRAVSPALLSYGPWASFLPDGERFVCTARQEGEADRVFVHDVAGGVAAPVTPQGVTVVPATHPVSPDGRYLAAAGMTTEAQLYGVDDRTTRPIPGAARDDVPLRFSADGTALYVCRRSLPAEIVRLDLRTGVRESCLTVVPREGTGLHAVTRVLVTPTVHAWAYTARFQLSHLYIADGLR